MKKIIENMKKVVCFYHRLFVLMKAFLAPTLITALSLHFTLYPQEKLELSFKQYVKNVRENHPAIKIQELDPELKKTILEEHNVISGFGGVLSSSYQQNFNNLPTTYLKPESKTLNYGWNYRLFQTGTSFGINFNNTFAPVNSVDTWRTTASLTVTQPLLFNGLLGNNVNNRNIKLYDYEISRVSQQISTTQIIMQSMIFYRQYEITEEINSLSKELLKRSKEILAFNRKRENVGTVNRSDILNSESQVIRNQIDVQNQDNTLEQLRESILYSMGHPEPDKNIAIKFTDSPNISDVYDPNMNFDKALSVAAKEREEFQLYSLQLSAAENAISLGKKALFPELNVFATYSFLGRDSELGGAYQDAFDGFGLGDTDLTVGVTFNISTEIDKYKLATQRPQQNKDLAQRALTDFQNNLRNDIRAKVRNYKTAYKVQRQNQSVLSKTRERYTIAREEYLIGKIDYTRLLQVEQELKQATINFLNSKVSYYRAELELDSAQGILLGKYGVN